MSGTHSEPRTVGLSSHYAVCHRAIALTGAGVIRQHRPVSSRCPGVGRPPAALTFSVFSLQCALVMIVASLARIPMTILVTYNSYDSCKMDKSILVQYRDCIN